MTLVFERAADGPGLHALIIAVGYSSERYSLVDSFPSGAMLAEWLVDHFHNPTAELASIDLLASRTGTADCTLTLAKGSGPIAIEAPTLDTAKAAVEAWWSRANMHAGNIALFYFAGHGRGRFADTLMYMDDRPDPDVPGASLQSLVEAMAYCEAERQLFLVDTSRVEKDEEVVATALMSPPRRPDGARPVKRAIYYAAAAGKVAYNAGIAEHLRGSPFLEAFLRAMETEPPATAPGILTAQVVGNRLRDELWNSAPNPGVRQQAEIDLTEDFDLHYPREWAQPAPAVQDGTPAPSAKAAAAGKKPRRKRPAQAEITISVEEIRRPADEEAGTDFVLDDAEAERDELGRGVLAIALARRLHKIWRKTNDPAGSAEADGRAAFVVHLDAPWGGGKTTFANFLAHVLNPLPRGRRKPAFFVDDRHPGADVGGLFIEDPPSTDAAAARLEALPGEARRPWIVIPFNAWRVEHCSPPWWVFYQAIRKGCFDAILAEGAGAWRPPPRPRASAPRWWQAADLRLRQLGRRLEAAWSRSRLRRLDLWLDLWFHELWWRLRNPKIATLIVTAAISAAALLVLQSVGAWGVTSTSDGAEAGFRLTDSFGVLLAGLTGITALWGFGALFTESIVPGTDSLAERLSLGSGDPFARFRRHFAETMKRVRRPVMVIVDDIDRCHPAFVVDLIRGMQTLLRSPRVVFVVVGDRDWIERAFEKHHEAMSRLDVGPEQTFGARFVEKAIQMSFILPALAADKQTLYVRRVLLGGREADGSVAGAPAATPARVDEARQLANRAAEAPHRHPFDTEGVVAEVSRGLAEIDRDRPDAAPLSPGDVARIVNETMATRATTDARVETEVIHELQRLAACFPANPRQIKRIVNTITLYYAVALQRQDIRPDADFRHQLALWVIVMTEWPQTWRLLASYPDLVDLLPSTSLAGALRRPGLQLPGSTAATRAALERIRADAELMAVICGKGDPGHDRLETRYVRTLAQLTPLYTRKRRLADEPRAAPAAAAVPVAT